ncbi:unnamed protein product [Clavelina lepadiformis]|uniref:WASH complex subunit 7 n=1 Tax=Clavelina lepadiformis TaxID=159417 RepID=A0ABP0FXJ4_CLALP
MASVPGESDYDQVDEASARIVGELQLKSYMRFMQDYVNELSDFESAIGRKHNELWDRRLNPIALQTTLNEKISLPDLIQTDNKVLNKVLIVLSALCVEIEKLEKEAIRDFYDPLMFYGEGAGDVDADQKVEGNEQLQIGRILPLLQKLTCFSQRCREVVKNVVQQLAALYNKSLPKVIDTTSVHFTTVFEHICVLLRVLVTLDEIVASNQTLHDHWAAYKTMMKSVHHSPGNFGVDASKLKPLEKLLARLERQIINSNMLNHALNQDFDDSGIPVTKNTLFSEEFVYNLKIVFVNIESKLGEQSETDYHLQYVGVCALFVLHYNLFHSLDKKFFKQIWDSQKKVPCICLTGHVTLFPDVFLFENMPPTSKAVDTRMKDQAAQIRNNWLLAKAQAIPRECQSYYAAVNNWMVKMTSGPSAMKTIEDLAARSRLFIEGLRLSNSLRVAIETVTNLHANINKPMTKSEVLSLFRMIALSKATADVFVQHSMVFVESSMHIVQLLGFEILKTLQAAKKRVVTDKKYSERRLDILSALVLCEQCIARCPTSQRLIVAKLALAVANQARIFREDEFTSLTTKFERLRLIGTVGVLNAAKIVSDQSSLYWHRALFHTYLDGLFQDPPDAARLHYIFAALEDCVVHLKRIKHFSSPLQLVEAFKEEITLSFKQDLLDKMCKEIENDLRLSVHIHLKLDDRNPFRVGVKSLRQLLAVQPINFLGDFIDVKAYVTHYLDQTFYNLTTVALHDWRTYAEMRNLASQKYQLKMQEVHLPNQQLEQGLDVLEIMRNIHVFVSKYLYNLNNQIFVESSSNNKHLNTINIRHIANSIRTHGTGIMNTTVNFTFQFLKKKFYIFSQFLFDEHIKSRLVKDMKEFRENRENYNQLYPYDKADRFNRGIRKLGLSQDGSTYLDQFRLLIAHIGNAMGYIRMVRSGGLHCCSDAIRYVPDLEEIANFEELTKDEDLSSEVNVSFAQFDSVIGSLSKNSAEGSDYLHMLVDVFAPEFRSSKNMHLRNFYIIIPALTLNFVEHIIGCKEKMNKKNKVGASFTDDGFAMGLAYILKLLNQYSKFDSLHWFQAVRRKYMEDVKSQQQANSDPKSRRQGNAMEDEKLQQTRALALKRINIYQREFELLYFSLSSARIFFRADVTAKEEATKAGNEDKAATDQSSSGEAPAAASVST